MTEYNQIQIDFSKSPKLLFIVPYRDREQHYLFFQKQMKYILEDYPKDDYQIWYIHQNDTREFNRGALKNIGFLLAKKTFPDTYKHITLVFNDVDTMPYTKHFLNYETTIGNVKHFYGYKFTLGGIVSITGEDFEKTKGYPNLWAWGFEDNALQLRVLRIKDLKIDRSQFYPIFDKNILQLYDGMNRLVNRTEFDRYINDTGEGYHSIRDLEYVINENTGFIDINYFSTGTVEDLSKRNIFNLSKGNRPFPISLQTKNKRNSTMNLIL